MRKEIFSHGGDSKEKVLKVEPYTGNDKDCQICEWRKATNMVTLEGGAQKFVCAPDLKNMPKAASFHP